MSSRKFLSTLAALLMLSAIGAADAPGAEFTFSATGNIQGHALENQVFTTNGGEVVCTGLSAAGAIEKTDFSEIHLTITYSGCKAYSLATVDISKATFTFTSNGDVHIASPITITPTIFGVSACTTTVAPQEVGTVAFSNAGANDIKVTPSVTGITYTATGGACGSSGSNGTYKGANEWSREGGGTVRFDP